MVVALLTLIALYVVYLLVHAGAFIGLLSRAKPVAPAVLPKLTVVIPHRNDGPELNRALRSLAQQSYPLELVQILVVDDHSMAKFTQGINHYLHEHKVKPKLDLLRLPKDAHGKKAALAMGIAHASTEWIITLDADCWPASEQWLEMMASYMQPGTQMVLGPIVKYEAPTQSLLQAAQVLEAGGLTCLTGGAVMLGQPTMANGGNLAFRKEAYEAVGGYNAHKHVPSGDDELLLHAIASKFGSKAIAFAGQEAAAVRTEALHTFAALWRQRLRWVSKAPAYKNRWMQASQLLAYLAHLALVVLVVCAGLSLAPWQVLWAAYGGYHLATAACTLLGLRLHGQLRYGPQVLWAPLVHLGYVLVIGLAGVVKPSISWKGRSIQSR